VRQMSYGNGVAMTVVRWPPWHVNSCNLHVSTCASNQLYGKCGCLGHGPTISQFEGRTAKVHGDWIIEQMAALIAMAH
jgi:hypothetical protein